MKVYIDSDEKKPLSFKHDSIKGTIVKKLDVADYQALYGNGKLSQVVFERKELGDLFGTLTFGYVRFKKEIKRAKEQNLILYIIIEEPFSTVLQGYQYSTVKGISIIRKLWTLYFYYGVYHVFCDSRKEMSTYITEMFIYCNNKQMWVNNE